MGLQLRSPIEVDVFLRQQFDGHIVDGVYLLLQDDGFNQSVNAVIALLIGVLGDEEGDTSLAQSLGILCHNVVAHDLNLATVGRQEELTDDMCL